MLRTPAVELCQRCSVSCGLRANMTRHSGALPCQCALFLLRTASLLQVIILLAALAVANAGFVGHAGYGHGYGHGGYGHGYGHAVVAKVAEAGASSQHRSQDLAGNYNFGYKEGHTSGSSFRQESGDAWGNKVGSYGLTDADGRVRVVKYVADGHGFRAHIATNEPGTAASHPAAASYNARHAVPAVGYGVAAPVAKVAVAAAVPVAAYAHAPYGGYGHGGYGHGYGGYGHGGYGHGYGGYGHGLFHGAYGGHGHAGYYG
ncbi:hypothetical protein HPB48_017237 [Haemaphysalis longicornis]|uniref:Cuticular protein n=1 Tax=Haemaphysalis longicornis TaxID=44386 RepID=A0A9J6H016_HAELO|nr:hypothetical protein HPB48_017237 [Haemaphysalis longicornis]